MGSSVRDYDYGMYYWPEWDIGSSFLTTFKQPFRLLDERYWWARREDYMERPEGERIPFLFTLDELYEHLGSFEIDIETGDITSTARMEI